MMILKPVYKNNSAQFNMTPLIDIVFLLVVFFMVLCQFIVAENFPVKVPDRCAHVQSDNQPGSDITTITVMRLSPSGLVAYAVGSETFEGKDTAIVEKITEAIDKRVKPLPQSKRIVCLRADKDIPYTKIQYALAAIAKSSTAHIQLAALKHPSPLVLLSAK
ncbi:MAG: biopolymer transporter ExbD [Planctomycetota bacterium]